MRNLKGMAVLAGIFMVFIMPVFAAQSIMDSVAVITDHSGSAKVYAGGKWKNAEVNMPLYEGDSLRTSAGSSMEITFDDATIVKLGDNTELTLAELQRKGSIASTVFNLMKGKFLAIVDKLKNTESKFEVHTKMAIAAVKGTELAVEAEADNTNLGVYTGSVQFTGKNGSVKGKRTVIVAYGNESGCGPGAPSKPSRIKVMAKFQREFGRLREEIRVVRELKQQGGDALYQWRIQKKKQVDGRIIGESNTEGTIGGTNKNIGEVKAKVRNALKARLKKEFYNEKSHAYKDLRFIKEEMQADVHLGKTMTDVHGNRVRMEEFIYRPAANQVDLLSVTLRDKNRLDYLKAENVFVADLAKNMTWAQWKQLWQKEWYSNMAPANHLLEQRVKMSNINDWIFTGTRYYPDTIVVTTLFGPKYMLLKEQEILAFGNTEITGDMTVRNFAEVPNRVFVREQRFYAFKPAGAPIVPANPLNGSQSVLKGPLDKTFTSFIEYNDTRDALADLAQNNIVINAYTGLGSAVNAMPVYGTAGDFTASGNVVYGESTAPIFNASKLAFRQMRNYNDGSNLSLNLYLIDDYGLVKAMLRPDAGFFEAIKWGLDLIFNTNVELSVKSNVFNDSEMGIDVVSKMLWWVMINPKNESSPSPGTNSNYIIVQ